MNARLRAIAAIVCVALLGVTTAAAQGDHTRLIGRVSDGSDGSLAGVVVAIVSLRLPGPVIVVTDQGGQYTSPPLPAGTYAVSFELAGFATRRTTGIALRAGEVLVVNGRMAVAPVSERVEVFAAAPPAEDIPRSRAPARPQARPLPAAALASVCGPGQPPAANAAIGKILGHRDDTNRTLFGDQDILIVDIGAGAGASVGQNYVVRRRFRVGDKTLPAHQASFGEHTAGLIQVVQTAAESSVAVVVYACGEFVAGDVIEQFDALPALIAQPGGTPRYDEPAHIIFGEYGRETGATHELMVIDRGSLQGAQRGQRVTIYRARRSAERAPASPIADAVIVSLREYSATIRIERASDAVTIGDLVALHR